MNTPATGVGAPVRSAGPFQASTAPSGGSALDDVKGVGVPLIGFGNVRHTRLKPARNAFAYPTYFLMLPLRSMKANGNGALARNRRSALSFFDSDHGDGRADCVGWLDELLHSEGIRDAGGELWLHTYPRIFGHTFKPVSFWYCHHIDGGLRAIVVEVNNTFGERHCYLLDRPQYGQELSADKVFHVSPFCTLEGRYRFRFMRIHNDGLQKTVARIDYDDADGPLLETSVSGTLVPVGTQSLRRALWRYPAMTFGIVARIHWQAFRLWCKRIPFVRKPEPPQRFVTR
ncbi:MAG: DUF1365 domain-containing protein [Polaromonas sp.]|nr:DUF1365 domain-containing protein [Polaromonas sp.]MDP2817365.1 DUF1365 domain-containing protein [Polaromonas sp.]